MDLQTLWFAAVAVLWTGFLLLEGFDFGVAALLPVLGRRPADRHLMLRSIGPLWDGNEVWLITAVGAVFAAFPGWYATWLPALYLPFVLVLFGLIVRAVAFEWRHSHHDPRLGRDLDARHHRRLAGRRARASAPRWARPRSACRSTPTATGSAARFAGLGWPALLGAVAVLAFSAGARRAVPGAEDRRAAARGRPRASPGAGRRSPRCRCWPGPALVHLRYGHAGHRGALAGRGAGRASSPGRGSGSTGRARRSPPGR